MISKILEILVYPENFIKLLPKTKLYSSEAVSREDNPSVAYLHIGSQTNEQSQAWRLPIPVHNRKPRISVINKYMQLILTQIIRYLDPLLYV